MKEIFQDYVRNSFGEGVQAEFKFNQFEFNYKGYFPQSRAVALLDVGIGRGEMLTCMKNWGYESYLGVDISPSTINFCRSLDLNCVLVEDSVAYLRQHPDEYAVITLLDVLEHIKKEAVIDFLRALHAALKPGGKLIVQVPNSQAPDAQLHRYNDITHEVGYIEHSLAQVFLTAGFQKFFFEGFEDMVFGTPKERVRKVLRSVYWTVVKFLRRVNGNLNPRILNPVFYAVLTK